MLSLDPLKPNESFVTIENEPLVAGIVTDEIHKSRLLSRNCLVPSVVDAFQSLNGVHLLLVGGITLATVNSVIESNRSRIHGWVQKSIWCWVLGWVRVVKRNGEVMENATRLYLRLVGTGSDHPRWAQT